MFQNEVSSSLEHSFEQSSPNNISGEQSTDVNYIASSENLSIESGYTAGSAYFQSSSQVYEEQFIEYAPDVYSDSYIVDDGSQVLPIYYPIPSYYEVYNGVSSVENNGTTFYNYYQFALPIYSFPSDLSTDIVTSGGSVSYTYEFANEVVENVNEDSLSSELTTENIASSDVSSMSDPDDFTNEIFENFNENSYSDPFTPSSNNGNDVASNDPPEELIDEFTEYYDEARDSSIMIPVNDFIAEERKNDIKRKKDWLYLLSLSGKLHVKDHIPEVHVMPEVLEEDEDVETSQGIFESGDSLEEELWTDVIPDIDKSDDDQKNTKKDTIQSCYANGAHKEKCQASGEENDLWKDFFYSMDDPVFGIEASFNNVFENDSCDKENAKKDALESSYTNGAHKGKCQASEEENYLWDDFFCSIDDPVFGIEACFNNASEKESSSDKELDKKKFNLSSTYGKTFMILTRLNKQIEILPTIQEEEEAVEESKKLEVMTEMLPVKINNKNFKSHDEGCLKSEQQNAEKMENNCGLPEATEEVGPSQKPTKKRFRRIRRFFSEIRSCFRKSKNPAG